MVLKISIEQQLSNALKIHSMATEITNLLDANEKTDNTKGDNQIEMSIWNQFIGGEQSDDKQDANARKDKISFQNATKFIISYITNNGTAAIQKALMRIGISDWKPSVEIEPGENSTTLFDEETEKRINKNMEYIKEHEQACKDNPEKAREMEETARKKINETKGKNGYTYKEACDVIETLINKYRNNENCQDPYGKINEMSLMSGIPEPDKTKLKQAIEDRNELKQLLSKYLCLEYCEELKNNPLNDFVNNTKVAENIEYSKEYGQACKNNPEKAREMEQTARKKINETRGKNGYTYKEACDVIEKLINKYRNNENCQNPYGEINEISLMSGIPEPDKTKLKQAIEDRNEIQQQLSKYFFLEFCKKLTDNPLNDFVKYPV